MKLLNIMTAAAILSLLSTAVLAQADSQAGDTAATPAQQGVQDAGPMDPVMMQNMMQMRQQRMQQSGDMPMGGPGCHNMMNPDRCKRMMQMRQQQMGQAPRGGVPMMDPEMQNKMMRMRYQRMMKKKQGGMMNPEMMRMRQQHMQTMEQRLTNIEKLLSELVELQKKK